MTIEVLFPEVELTIGGEVIKIKPFTFGELPKVMKVMSKVAIPAQAALNNGTISDIGSTIQIFAEGGDDLIAIMATNIGKPVSFINNLAQDEGIKLLKAFYEVNASFFKGSVLPLLKGAQKQAV